jgi:hypothetical protein
VRTGLLNELLGTRDQGVILVDKVPASMEPTLEDICIKLVGSGNTA